MQNALLRTGRDKRDARETVAVTAPIRRHVASGLRVSLNDNDDKNTVNATPATYHPAEGLYTPVRILNKRYETRILSYIM